MLIPCDRKNILVVDDDATTAELLAEYLSEEYDVRTAHDGAAGLRAIRARRPDLIICDVNMPRMDGHSMVRTMHAVPGHHPPVIFVTARGTSADVLMGIQSGARHYLTKPVDLHELALKVHRALHPTIPPPPPRLSPVRPRFLV